VNRRYEYLDVDDLLALAVVLLGDPPPVRDIGRLASAAARPAATAFGEEAYADVWQKAAALLQSVVKDHPLVDGNKRLGWLACAVFLDLNGVDPTTASPSPAPTSPPGSRPPDSSPDTGASSAATAERFPTRPALL
jgi:death-on-curing protein